MFDNVTNLMPGTTEERCIDVTYTGTVDPTAVKLYRSGAPTGTLAPYLDLTIQVGTDSTPAFRNCTGFVSAGTLYTGTLANFASSHAGYANGLTAWDPTGTPSPETRTFRFGLSVQDNTAADQPDLDLWFLVGNAHQLTTADREAAGGRGHGHSHDDGRGKPAAKPWLRPVLYGAGTVSMLMISMVSSLSLWIALPWAFLGWSPTLVTTGSMEPLVTPGDVVMIRPVSATSSSPTPWSSSSGPTTSASCTASSSSCPTAPSAPRATPTPSPTASSCTPRTSRAPPCWPCPGWAGRRCGSRRAGSCPWA